MTRRTKNLVFIILFQFPLIFSEKNFTFTKREGLVNDSTFQKYSLSELDETKIYRDTITNSDILIQKKSTEVMEQIIKKKDYYKKKKKAKPKKRKFKYNSRGSFKRKI